VNTKHQYFLMMLSYFRQQKKALTMKKFR